MQFLKVLGSLFVLGLIALASFILGYDWIYPTYVVRYRMTVRVSVDSQEHVGSSVVELRVSTQPRLLDAPPMAFHTRGEATFVDLGNGRNLVARLGYPIFGAFGVPYTVDGAAQLPNLRGERQMPPGDLPTFVTFADANDPLSVETVDPAALQEKFGPGIRLESVTVSITDDPVTHDLEQKLPWLGDAPLSRADPRRMAMVKAHLGRLYFIRSDP